MKELLKQEESMIPGMFFNLRKALLPLMDDASYDAMASVVARIDQQGQASRDLIRTHGSSKRQTVGALSTSNSSSSSSSTTEPNTSTSELGKRPADEDSREENATTKVTTGPTGITASGATGDAISGGVSTAQCTDG